MGELRFIVQARARRAREQQAADGPDPRHRGQQGDDDVHTRDQHHQERDA